MQTTIPMADGTTATYTKGSFHVLYNGAAYINYDRYGPHVFTPNCVGKKTKEGLQIKSGKKATITLRAAKTHAIPVKVSEPDAQYVEGSFELQHNGDTYLYVSNTPPMFIQPDAKAFVKNNKLQIPVNIGRSARIFEFEKQTDESSNKRRRVDEGARDKYIAAEKRAATLKQNAPRAIELANKALAALRELMLFEDSSRAEAGTGEEMFETGECPLSEADAAIRAVVECAEAEIDE